METHKLKDLINLLGLKKKELELPTNPVSVSTN